MRLLHSLKLRRLLNVCTVQSHIQHYSEPAAESDSLPATSTLNSTLLPLGPGTLTHNTSGIPIIVVCAKADLIDEGNEPVGGASGMGGMVKGKGSEWEEQTDHIVQVLRVICLKCGCSIEPISTIECSCHCFQMALRYSTRPRRPRFYITSGNTPFTCSSFQL